MPMWRENLPAEKAPLKTEKPGVMGPGVRRDDMGGVRAAPHPLPVIPGRAKREPGIHNHERGLWIPGPRQEGASRNDGFRAKTHAPE